MEQYPSIIDASYTSLVKSNTLLHSYRLEIHPSATIYILNLPHLILQDPTLLQPCKHILLQATSFTSLTLSYKTLKS